MVPVSVASAHLVAVRRISILVAVPAGAGWTVGPGVEVTTKGWPVGWVIVLVIGVAPGGFVALGIARA